MQIRQTLTLIGIVLGLGCASTEADAAMKTPGAVSAVATASTRIVLPWNDSNMPATGFRIERGVSPATPYYYRVRAMRGSTQSQRSPVANAITRSTQAPPTVASTPVATQTAMRTATALPTATTMATPVATNTATAIRISTPVQGHSPRRSRWPLTGKSPHRYRVPRPE